MTEDSSWADRAACRGATALWYGDSEAGKAEQNADMAKAKRICMTRCPVLRECEAHTLTVQRKFLAQHGVWAGRSGRSLRRWYDRSHQLADQQIRQTQEQEQRAS